MTNDPRFDDGNVQRVNVLKTNGKPAYQNA